MHRCVAIVMSMSSVMTSSQGVAQDYRPARGNGVTAQYDDFRNDWTFLSPRRHCLGKAGLKDAGDSPVIVFTELSTMEWMLEDNFKISPAQRVKNYTAGDLSGTAFSITVSKLSNELGYVAAQAKVDLRRVKAISDALTALRSPTPFESPNVRLWQDKEAAAEGLILKNCSVEFIAFAFGIGEAAGERRYVEARNAWLSLGPDRPIHYPPSLASLNYMAERELLKAGNPARAFLLSREPVMEWAGKNIPNASYWLASFHQYGIGTSVSLPAAIAIFDQGVGELDQVESARLKALAGRKSEALQQITQWEKKAWRSPENTAKANVVYRAISGRDMRLSGDGQTLSGLLIALPLAIVAYCLQSINNCPSLSSSNVLPREDITSWGNEDRKKLQESFDFTDNMLEASGMKY